LENESANAPYIYYFFSKAKQPFAPGAHVVVWVEAGGRACLTVYMESGLALDLRIASPETGRHTKTHLDDFWRAHVEEREGAKLSRNI